VKWQVCWAGGLQKCRFGIATDRRTEFVELLAGVITFNPHVLHMTVLKVTGDAGVMREVNLLFTKLVARILRYISDTLMSTLNLTPQRPTVSQIENAFRPSKEIDDPERFAGRKEPVQQAYFVNQDDRASGRH
jgi:hypothetical protein